MIKQDFEQLAMSYRHMMEKQAFMMGEILSPEQIAAMQQAAEPVVEAAPAPGGLAAIPEAMGAMPQNPWARRGLIGAGVLGAGALAAGAAHLYNERSGAKGVSHNPAGMDQTASVFDSLYMEKQAFAPLLAAGARVLPVLARGLKSGKGMLSKAMNSGAAQKAEKVLTSRPFNIASGGLMAMDMANTVGENLPKVTPPRAPQP